MLLIFCLLRLANVGFDISLELVECGHNGPAVDGVCYPLIGLLPCMREAALILDTSVTCGPLG
jgi:hypothetical protein